MAEFVLDKVVHPLCGEVDSVNTGEQGRDLRSHGDLLGQVVSNVAFFPLQHTALFCRNKFPSLMFSCFGLDLLQYIPVPMLSSGTLRSRPAGTVEEVPRGGSRI